MVTLRLRYTDAKVPIPTHSRWANAIHGAGMMRLSGVLRNRSVPRITGAAVGIAGLAFIGLGTAGVGTITSVVGHATPVDCSSDTDVPSGNACVLESFEGLTAAQDQANGVSNDC